VGEALLERNCGMRFVIYLLSLVLSINLVQARTIKDDWGGLVQAYYERVRAINVRREAVRIDGPCASACTMYLGVKRLCVTQNASFHFHKPWGRATPSQFKRVNDWFYEMWPTWVERWVKANRALASIENFKTMSAAYALKFLPECR
jgi:hypothetical protein